MRSVVGRNAVLKRSYRTQNSKATLAVFSSWKHQFSSSSTGTQGGQGAGDEGSLSRTFSIPAGHVADPHSKELRRDVKNLGKVLGSIMEKENAKVFENVESLRLSAKEFRKGGESDKNLFQNMIETAKAMPAEDAKGVARAFAHFLALSNCAETHHRVRELESLRQKKADGSPFPPKQDSVRGAISELLQDEQLTPQQVLDTISSQSVELVLTAHPTEVNRRTVIEKHRRVRANLAATDMISRSMDRDSDSFEKREVDASIRREIASLWASDEIRRFKPTPLNEAQGGLAVIESVLWDAVPNYLNKVNAEMQRQLTTGENALTPEQAQLPLDCAPIRFASWIGGDRDGNPNVLAKTTIQASALNRWYAARLYLKNLSELYDELSMSTGFTERVKDLASNIKASPDDAELYRRIIGNLRIRLKATAEKYEAIFGGEHTNSSKWHTKYEEEPIELIAELMEPLMKIHESLVNSGREEIANGRLADTIRRVAVFGLTIMPLDIRQESGRHLEAIDAITQHLGMGSYAQWSEETKINWLCQELSSARPLLGHQAVSDFASLGFSETVVDTLETFRAASELGQGALGAYVISQAKASSDVLAVTLLMQEFGMVGTPCAAGEGGNGAKKNIDVTNSVKKPMMRVVPLFETLDDLNNAPDIVKRLLSLPAYMGRVGGRMETMVGYSDSAKDAGRLAASWAQFLCQEKLSKLCKEHQVELSLFHGRGGTVGRGGSPAVYRAILAHPPGTINGRFRVTEQGEMITQNFGHHSIAERTLDVYTSAVLREKHCAHSVIKPEWRKAMDLISEASCSHYRSIVREEPAFVPYFRAVTPEKHLGSLNIGSRPAKRNPKGGVESLRAIPWQFGWAQTRHHLPAWLGVNKGLSQSEDVKNTLKEMYAEWPWFRELLDLIAMVLAKADESVIENYENQLIPVQSVPEEIRPELFRLGKEIRQELKQTIESVLEVSDQQDLNMGNDVLSRELEVRGPYMDSLNVLQCEVMKRIENNRNLSEEEKDVLNDCLLITINGLSAGLRNTG